MFQNCIRQNSTKLFNQVLYTCDRVKTTAQSWFSTVVCVRVQLETKSNEDNNFQRFTN